MFRKYIEHASDLKNKGNKAYKSGNREEAISSFQDASETLEKLLMKSLSEAQERETETRRLLAVCLSNSAAARLLPVDGQKDPEGAIADAQRAIEADASYAKA